MHGSKRFALSVILAGLLYSGCSTSTTDPDNNNGSTTPTGKILFTGIWDEVIEVNLATGTSINHGRGGEASRHTDGATVYVFGDLVEASSDWTQSRKIVDQGENPDSDYDNLFHDPRVSPNGQMVAYGGLFGQVYVVDRISGTLIAGYDIIETSEGFKRPSWTADNRLVMTGIGATQGIFLVDPMTENDPVRIDANLNSPSHAMVSHDGKKIAATVAGHVYTMNIDGSNLQQVTTSSKTEEYAVWSPDDKWLAVKSDNSIWLVPLTGTGDPIDVYAQYPAFSSASSIVSPGQIDWSR